MAEFPFSWVLRQNSLSLNSFQPQNPAIDDDNAMVGKKSGKALLREEGKKFSTTPS
jgi:hypothetical protein